MRIDWTVDDPSTGGSLTVKADPLVSWSYRDAAALASPIAGEPIDADKAITLATQMLAGIGVDTSKIDWQVDRFEGLTRVTGWQLIDDARTQLSWVLGFDPMWVLRRMTSDAAKVMGVDHEVGSIGAGKFADVIVVGGDPLRHIDVLRDPKVVIRHGRRYR